MPTFAAQAVSKTPIMNSNPKCLRCDVEMETGYILDASYAMFRVPTWVAGESERSVFSGIKVRGKEQRQLVTFRCPTCGLLESHANQILR